MDSAEKIYAKVVDGKVIEYPVKESYIAARGQSLAAYTECVFDRKPDVPNFYNLATTTKVVTPDTGSTYVQVSYNLLPMSLEQVLQSLPNAQKYARMQNIPLNSETTYGGTYPSQTLFEQIVAMVRTRVQENMDAFAQTRKYDDIASAISYENSVVPKYHDEGGFCHSLRDWTWAALELYTEKVLKSEVVLPYRWELVSAQLPPMEWPSTLSTALA